MNEKFIVVDYAKIERRMLAMLEIDRRMLVATSLFASAEERRRAKVREFVKMYGTGRVGKR